MSNGTKILVATLAVLATLGMADVPASKPATAPAAAGTPARVKVTCLGVSVVGLDPAAAKQLNLAAGSGLRVSYVVPKSPADLAGLKNNDVLVKLDDQLLINLQQFTVLVRSYPPGRPTALKIFRGTEGMTLTANLGQQEVPAAADAVEARSRWTGMGPNSFQATIVNGKYLVKFVMEGNSKSLTVTDVKTGGVIFSGPINTQGELDKAPQDVLPLLPKMEKDCKVLQEQVQLPPPPKFVPTQVVYGDAKYNITLRVDNSQKFLVVKDKAGVTLFGGPVDTPQQVQSLPAEFQTRLKIMERSLQPISGPSATRPADK